MSAEQIDQQAAENIDHYLQQFPDKDKETALMLLIVKASVLVAHVRGAESAHNMLEKVGQAVDASVKSDKASHLRVVK